MALATEIPWGSPLAKELAGRGARVVLVARGEAELERVVGEIRARGGEAWAVPGDVSDRNGVHALAGAAAALAGPISILVNGASVLGPAPLRLLLDTECEDFEAVLAANLVGPFRLTKLVAAPMVLAGRGLIVNVTSDASVVPYERWGAYGVSKAALDHLGRIWAAELEPLGVRLLTVDPGEMDTAMHAAAVPDADRSILARPADVAIRIAEMIERAEEIPSGTRLEASKFDSSRAHEVRP